MNTNSLKPAKKKSELDFANKDSIEFYDFFEDALIRYLQATFAGAGHPIDRDQATNVFIKVATATLIKQLG